MRTTLAIDGDLATQLRELARVTGRPLEQIVNDAIRRGLAAGAKPFAGPPRFRVRSRACGFRSGIDVARLNQLVDEIDLEVSG